MALGEPPGFVVYAPGSAHRRASLFYSRFAKSVGVFAVLLAVVIVLASSSTSSEAEITTEQVFIVFQEDNASTLNISFCRTLPQRVGLCLMLLPICRASQRT